MIQVLSLLMVLVLSLVIARVATVALTITGLSREVARFQTRSALTGAGFTTSESEAMVSHPVRRRIVMWLMLVGNGGLVIVAALIITVVSGVGGSALGWPQLLGLAIGLAVVAVVARSSLVDRWLSRWIEWALKRYTDLDVRDYAGLLRLRGEYSVSELAVEEGDWMADRKLSDLMLSREGVLVLGVIRRDGAFLGAPRGDTVLLAGNTLLIYGRGAAIQALDQREAGLGGQLDHIRAMQEQMEQEERERAEDVEEAQAEAEREAEAEAEAEAEVEAEAEAEEEVETEAEAAEVEEGRAQTAGV